MDDKPQLSGRPRLENGARNKVIKARLTEDEFKKVEELELALGMNRTDIVRMRVLRDIEKVAVNSRELIMKLDLISTETARIGNNINQVARHANTMNLRGAVPTVIFREFNLLFEGHIRLQRELEQTLRSVLRSLSAD